MRVAAGYTPATLAQRVGRAWRGGVAHGVMARVGVFLAACLQLGGASVAGRWAGGLGPGHRHAAPACRLDQEPLRVGQEGGEEGGVREAGGHTATLLQEAPQGPGRRALGSRPALRKLGRAWKRLASSHQVQVPAGVHNGVDDCGGRG